MKLYNIYIVVIILIKVLNAGILPQERRIDWTPGLQGEFPDKSHKINVRDFEAKGDGVSDDTQAFLDAIKAIAEEGGEIFIPEGSYLIKQPLTIDRGILFKGEAADKTRLFFDLAKQSKNCITFVKIDHSNWVTIKTGYKKGSQKLVVDDPGIFQAGDFVEIQQENDPEIMYTNKDWEQPWAQNAVGQILKIDAVNQDTLLLNKPLYMEYRLDLNPKIRTIGMVMYPGVEDLYIKRLDAGDGHTIEMRYTAFGRVQRIESAFTYRTHIYLCESYGCEIRNNYLHHSHDYGGGGHGYGVDVILHSTDNLIIDNIFKYLRHSMMTHVGASGNVFAYNFSTEREPQNLCDISLHGHYGNYNLFESNVIEEINVSDYWGPMGPGNTFLRNKITEENIQIRDDSHDQNFIGNVLLANSSIRIFPDVNGTFVHGNIIKDMVDWDDDTDDREIPVSYYLQSKPQFLMDIPWPLFGPDVSEDYILPAQMRYESGSPITNIKTFPPTIPKGYNLRVFPTPFNPETTIYYTLREQQEVKIQIYTIRGRLLTTLVDSIKPAGTHIVNFQPDKQVASGIYFVTVNTEKVFLIQKVILIK